ncbi:uncharacterized protein LOC144589972 isoform X2 [Rhinoraja longicauda]
MDRCAASGAFRLEWGWNKAGKFDRGAPHSRTLSEDECDPMEGPSGCTIHPHSKGSKTTGGSRWETWDSNRWDTCDGTTTAALSPATYPEETPLKRPH